MSQIREMPKTDRGGDVPLVRQVSVFTENRVGALAELLAVFDSTKVRILALTILPGIDCAIVRFVFNETDVAVKELDAHYRFTVCDLVAVELPPGGGDGLQLVARALLAAEIDIHYCYALITSEKIHPSIVVHVDNPSLAALVLADARFHLLDEADFRK